MFGYVFRIARLNPTRSIVRLNSFSANTFVQPQNVNTKDYTEEFNKNTVNNAPIERTKIDEETIAHLERLSLVDCANKEGIKILEDAIAFADRIQHINTDGVEPMYSVLENRYLNLREDQITEGNCQKDILSNAALTEEGYFVAPPGNIPLAPRENLLHLDFDENINK